MKRSTIGPLMLAACAAIAAGGATAQTPQRDTVPSQARTQTQDRVYGSELMTEQERNEYHKRMSQTKTEQEREQLRKEQHERMNERAKQRGLTLPDDARARGPGPTPRQGQGAGAGGGGGAGAGGGKGR